MKVYLIPDEDSTYVSCVSTDAPSDDAIFLVEEGTYPVEAWHERHDLNMDRLLMREEINNRDELIQYLDFIGAGRHALLNLWDYDINVDASDELLHLFDVCYKRMAELICADMMDACEGIDSDNCDYDNVDAPVIPAVDDFDAHPDRLPF